MTTLAELKTKVARKLRDPDGNTFDDDDLEDFIGAAFITLGRIAPQRFVEDIDPVADALEYTLTADDAFSVAVPEIEVMRVELWNTALTPAQAVDIVEPGSQAYVNFSENGWTVWNGVLQLPRHVPLYLAGREDDYLIRVWGYAPYPVLVADEDVSALSAELESAALDYCRMQAYDLLTGDRSLFDQWQTRSNNTDISPAALLNMLMRTEESWRRKEHALTVLREAPG